MEGAGGKGSKRDSVLGYSWWAWQSRWFLNYCDGKELGELGEMGEMARVVNGKGGSGIQTSSIHRCYLSCFLFLSAFFIFRSYRKASVVVVGVTAP